MRIVAGTLRGRALVAPKGHSTRPTADRARQALFDVLEHAPWRRPIAGARALDLFAGSGALGLEALSRGASWCLFMDISGEARSAIAANLDALRLADRAAVSARDASRLPPLAEAPFDLAFIDPPYRSGLAEDALAGLAAGGWLAPGALAVVERGADEGRLEATGWRPLDERRWGAARVDFLELP